MKTYRLNGTIADYEYHSDFFDVCSPKGLKKFLDSLDDGERAEIEINSPGGYVVYGIEMANAIKNSKAHIVAHVTGMAASMASVVACACDEIVMEEASFMMIHDPWGYTEGNAAEMRKEAALLDQMKEVCMSFYLAKFDRSRDELAALMSDETWYTGNECAQNGLKCSVVKSDLKAAACIAEQHFKSIPEAALAFLKVAPLTDDQKALLAAAKAEQTAAGGTLVPPVRPDEAACSVPSAQAACSVPSAQPACSVPSAQADGSWEARYKGASRKINDITAELQTANGKLQTLQGQLDESQNALASAQAEIEQLRAAAEERAKTLEARDKDLAEIRDSLAKAESEVQHLKETRQLLTAGVLSPGANGDAKPSLRSVIKG